MNNNHVEGDIQGARSRSERDPLEEFSARVAELSFSGSNSQRAFDMILWGIQTGHLPSGTRLAEIPVARAIGLGRTPVREALVRLEADGFVTTEPRVGLVVAGNTLQSLAEIYEVREVLEAFAARLASCYARPGDIFAIRQVLDAFEEPTRYGDVVKLRGLNTQFHRAIHEAAHNDQLRRILDRLHNLIRLSPVSAYSAPGRAEDALREHWEIFEAITVRDEEKAASLTSEHKRRDKEARLSQMAWQPASVGGEPDP